MARLGRHLKQMGLTRLGDLPPHPIEHVLQRRVLVNPDRPILPQLPAQCDKCGNRLARLALAGRELHCPGAGGGCGRTWYLVTHPAIDAEGRGKDSR